MNRRLWVLLLAAGWALSASAADDPRVVEGIRLYQTAKLVEARGVLGAAVDDPGLAAADQAEARLYLAAAYHALGDPSAARAQLVILFDRHPGTEVSPALFVPGMVELAEQVRDEIASRPVALPTGTETGGSGTGGASPDATTSGAADAGATRTGTTGAGDARTGMTAAGGATTGGAAAGSTSAAATTGGRTADALRGGTPADPIGGELAPAGPEPGGLSGTVSLWGVGEVLGRSVGFGASLTLGWQGAELSPRVLFGENIGIGLEVGYAFLDARVTPRLLVRGTYFPKVGWGGGQALGLRVRLGGGLVLTGDFGVELFSVPSGYRDLGLVGTLGLGWEVFGR